MENLGFGGQFLDSVKSIYSGDSIQCVVNGVSTRPIFLRRGVRQGCSMSPMLFALYISELGQYLVLMFILLVNCLGLFGFLVLYFIGLVV